MTVQVEEDSVCTVLSSLLDYLSGGSEMEAKDYLSSYYEGYDENARLISRHGMVEYITTMKYVEKYLQPGMRVLESGAAPGRYSHELVQKGY